MIIHLSNISNQFVHLGPVFLRGENTQTLVVTTLIYISCRDSVVPQISFMNFYSQLNIWPTKTKCCHVYMLSPNVSYQGDLQIASWFMGATYIPRIFLIHFAERSHINSPTKPVLIFAQLKQDLFPGHSRRTLWIINCTVFSRSWFQGDKKYLFNVTRVDQVYVEYQEKTSGLQEIVAHAIFLCIKFQVYALLKQNSECDYLLVLGLHENRKLQEF